jgi:hypothetical protein
VFRADEGDCDHAILGGAILPGMARAVLDDAVAGFEEDFGALVEFEIDFAGEDDVEVYGVGSVHAGVHWFEDFDHAGEFGLDFGEGRGEIGVLRNFAGAGRNGEEGETETAGGREVTGMRGRPAVAGEFWDGIGTPEAVEFEAGEEGEGDWFDGGVFHEDGFAGGVAACDYAADVHGRVLQISKKRRDCTFSGLIGEVEKKNNAECAESAEGAEKRGKARHD